MAYIIAVNVRIHKHEKLTSTDILQAAILSDTGGTCICHSDDKKPGMCTNDDDYDACQRSKSLLISHTAAY